MMSPTMALEMSSKTNAGSRHPSLSDRRHVRNLWPSVGGGLPGGKPIEPAAPGSLVPVSREPPPGRYGQSTGRGRDPTTARPTAAEFVDNSYKSSQAQPDRVAAADVGHAFAGYGLHYGQQPSKCLQPPLPPASASAGHWCPPPSPQTQATRTYVHQDPTILFNQVRLSVANVFFFMFFFFALE